MKPLRAFTTRYSPWRRLVQTLALALLILAPFTDLLRLDVTGGTLHLLGFTIGTGELHIFVLLLMLAMFVFGGLSFFVGRAFCGWLCPKMAVNELGDKLERLVNGGELLRREDGLALTKRLTAGAALTLSGALIGAGLGFVFASYVYPWPLVLEHLTTPVLSGASGTVAVFAGLIAVDVSLIRHRFCKSACPYGLMQALVADRNSLLVKFRNRDETGCIDCGACQEVCPEDLDIRKSPHQLPCISCGLCIDACADVMDQTYPEQQAPSLIHFIRGGRWGYSMEEEPWWKRLGLTDWKRYATLASIAVLILVTGWQVVRSDPLRIGVSASAAGESRAALSIDTDCLTRECGAHRLAVELLAKGVSEPVAIDTRMIQPGETSGPVELTAPGSGTLRVTLTDTRDTGRTKTRFFRIEPGESGLRVIPVPRGRVSWPTP